MPRQMVDLTGMRFGRLSVIRRDSQRGHKGYAHFACVCDCGRHSRHRSDHLRDGRARSCGCLHVELASARATTHGDTKGRRYSREYACWRSMLDRCSKPSQESYRLYGERGVTVCERWRESFDNFLGDMGRKPTSSHSIDRIHVEGNYEPSNCRWATPKQQGRNKRTNRIINHNGLSLTLVEWTERTGIKASTISMRLDHYGWNVSEALSTKPRRRRVALTT
jgi:hypothetical protein